jgi:heme/copper-type cytochrome/quinol oxidase subunit 2
MLHSPQSFRIGAPKAGFGRGYPRVPTIVSAGIVAALLIALLVAGISLTTELIGPAGLEDGAEAETLVLSGTVVVLTLGLAALLVAMLRRYVSVSQDRKDPPIAA